MWGSGMGTPEPQCGKGSGTTWGGRRSSGEYVSNPSLGRGGVSGTQSDGNGSNKEQRTEGCYEALFLECSLNLFLSSKKDVTFLQYLN